MCPKMKAFHFTLVLDWEGHRETASLMKAWSTVQFEGRITPRGGIPALGEVVRGERGLWDGGSGKAGRTMLSRARGTGLMGGSI